MKKHCLVKQSVIYLIHVLIKLQILVHCSHTYTKKIIEIKTSGTLHLLNLALISTLINI